MYGQWIIVWEQEWKLGNRVNISFLAVRYIEQKKCEIGTRQIGA
jgi:hypothetical protein